MMSERGAAAAAAPPHDDGGGAPSKPDHLGFDVSQASPMMNGSRRQRLIHTLARHAGGIPGTAGGPSSPRRRGLGIDGGNGNGSASATSLLSSVLGQGQGNVQSEGVPLAYCESCSVSYGVVSGDGAVTYASSSYASSTVSGGSSGSSSTTTTTTTCVSCRRTMTVSTTSNMHPISPHHAGTRPAATGGAPGDPTDLSDGAAQGSKTRLLHTLPERRESSAAGSEGGGDRPPSGGGGDHDATALPVVPATLGMSSPPSLPAIVPPPNTDGEGDDQPPPSPFMCGIGDALSGILCSSSNGAGRVRSRRGSSSARADGHPEISVGRVEEDDALQSTTTSAETPSPKTMASSTMEFVDLDGPGSDRAVTQLASEMEEVAAARLEARRLVERERNHHRRRSRGTRRDRYDHLVVEGLAATSGGARPAEVEEGAATDGLDGRGVLLGTETPSPTTSQTTTTRDVRASSSSDGNNSPSDSNDLSSHASSRKENAAPTYPPTLEAPSPPGSGGPGRAEKGGRVDTSDVQQPPPLSDERRGRISDNNSAKAIPTTTSKSASHSSSAAASASPSSSSSSSRQRSSKILGRGRRHLANKDNNKPKGGGGTSRRSRSSSLRRKLSSKSKKPAESKGRTASPHFGGRVVGGAASAGTIPHRGRDRGDERMAVGQDHPPRGNEDETERLRGEVATTEAGTGTGTATTVETVDDAGVPETGVASVVVNGGAAAGVGKSRSSLVGVGGEKPSRTRFMRHDDDGGTVASQSQHSSPLKISPQMHREEFHDTYGAYRVSSPPNVVRDVLDRVDTSIDPYFVAKRGVHVCSEPNAGTLKVRGATYSRNGVKVPSETSMFALLGVDNLLKDPQEQRGMLHCCQRPGSYLSRLRRACERNGIVTPFLLVINMVVPWGNLLAYMYRPDGTNGGPFNEARNDVPSERCWKAFLSNPSKDYRNQKLKFIPRICVGPWMIKKTVGRNPAMIGQKLPTTYYGSLEEKYLEICFDVAGGSQVANSIANAVVGSANAVTVDLGFVIEGGVDHRELPEQILGLFRLHHVAMKKAMTNMQWRQEVEKRERERGEIHEDSKTLGPGMAEI